MISWGGRVAVVATFAVVRTFAAGVRIMAVRNPEIIDCWWFILRIACLGLVLTTAALYKCWALNLSSMLW
jgi:hypothetical protein